MKLFNERIRVDNQVLSFHFNLMHTIFGQKFLVTVNKDKQVLVIDMHKDNHGKWEIVGSAPQWVEPIEEKLVDIITRNIYR
jgi:hypothetical protein